MTLFLVADIETLGMAPPAAIIELGWSSVSCDLSAIAEDRDLVCEHGEMRGEQLFGMQGQIMSPDNRAVHHIDPFTLQGRRDYDPSFLDALVGPGGRDIDAMVAHNAEFEESFLGSDIPWLCTYKIALRLWPDAPSHGNQCLKYLLGIEDGDEYHPPHRALPDALVTAQILERILCEASRRMAGSTGEAVLERLLEISREPRLLPRCPIGQEWKGRPWREVDSGFLSWMLRQPTMEADLKWNAERELTRRRRGD